MSCFLYQDSLNKFYNIKTETIYFCISNKIVQNNKLFFFILSYTEPGLSDVILVNVDDVAVYFGIVDETSSFVTSL